MKGTSSVRFALGAVFLCSFSGNVQAQRKSIGSSLRPEHREVISRWVAASPRRANLRVATERDCRNREGLREYRKQEGKNYNPYYVVGDFNRDSKEDFAVAFVDDRRRRSKFAFAIFNGPFGGSAVPAYADENVDLGELGFFWGDDGQSTSNAEENYLILGEFQGDFVCVMYRPRGKRYVPKPCLDE